MNRDAQPAGVRWYHDNAEQLAAQYERVRFEDVHGWLIYRLPTEPGSTVLDIGAGSGRDAAWLAERGHDVVAVEPAIALRSAAQRAHPNPRIQWLDDQLPDLSTVHRLGTSFDVILASAVWMHVTPSARSRAFRKLITLLKPGGLLAMTLRLGEPDAARDMHPVSIDEIQQFAREHGAYVEYTGETPDALGREGVSWAEIAIRLPDDG